MDPLDEVKIMIRKSERKLEKFQKAFEEDTKVFNERMDRLAESQEKNDNSIYKFSKFVNKDKQIIGMVGGKFIGADAVKLAHDCDFVVLTPEEQGLKVNDAYA